MLYESIVCWFSWMFWTVQHNLCNFSMCQNHISLQILQKLTQEQLHKNEAQLPLVIVIISHNLMSSINVQSICNTAFLVVANLNFQVMSCLISWRSSDFIYQHYFNIYRMFKIMIWIIYQSANMWWWVMLFWLTINYRL